MFRGLTDAQLGQVCPVWDRWAPAPPKRIVCPHGTTCELIVETTLTGARDSTRTSQSLCSECPRAGNPLTFLHAEGF